MLKTIITPYNRQHQTFSIGTSIGIAIYSQDGSDMETILNAADNAMYEAKNKRKRAIPLCFSFRFKRSLFLWVIEILMRSGFFFVNNPSFIH